MDKSRVQKQTIKFKYNSDYLEIILLDKEERLVFTSELSRFFRVTEGDIEDYLDTIPSVFLRYPDEWHQRVINPLEFDIVLTGLYNDENAKAERLYEILQENQINLVGLWNLAFG